MRWHFSIKELKRAWAGRNILSISVKNKISWFSWGPLLVCWSACFINMNLNLSPVRYMSHVTWRIMLWLTQGSNIRHPVFEFRRDRNEREPIHFWASHKHCFLCERLPLTSIRCRLTTSSTVTPSAACVLTNCDAFIPGSIPPKQALALTEQSVMAMFIVHALNRQHMAWAAVSGAKFVPLCSFRGYLWLAPCWLDALLADNGSLCVTDC